MRSLVMVLWVGFLTIGCEDSPAPPAEAAPQSPTAETEPQPEAEAPPARPRTKQHQLPARDRLGVLPEEVGIAVGERAPDATVQNADGEPVRLQTLIERGPIALVFYRGGWCPFCNFQIRALTEDYPQYRERGVTPVAISVDSLEEAQRTRATYEIPFPVLSDPDLAAHRAYRVMHEVDDAEHERLRGYGIDIEGASGRDHHVIAIPAIFIIDRAGVVRWAHADPEYRVRPSNEQVLAAIDTLELGE